MDYRDYSINSNWKNDRTREIFLVVLWFDLFVHSYVDKYVMIVRALAGK